MKKNKEGEVLLTCIFIPLAVGAVATFFTRGNMSLYTEVNQPPFSPPSWLFPIVWIVLYIVMGIASFLVWQRRGYGIDAEKGLALYGLQLIVNFFWPIFFFNLRWYLFSFLWLVLLWILIDQTIRLFGVVSKKAARLMIPYLIWVTFAGYLNLGIFLLNR